MLPFSCCLKKQICLGFLEWCLALPILFGWRCVVFVQEVFSLKKELAVTVDIFSACQAFLWFCEPVCIAGVCSSSVCRLCFGICMVISKGFLSDCVDNS